MKNPAMQVRHTKLGISVMEMLICLALVAMLAAIAVPNFMLAQTSTNIAQAKQDLKSLKVGLEAYKVDVGAYPWQIGLPTCLADGPYAGINQPTLERLTTPVSYLGGATPFYDPFVATAIYSGNTFDTVAPLTTSIRQQVYFYNARNLRDTSAWGQSMPHDVDPYWYFLESAGPDLHRHWPFSALNGMETDTAANRISLLLTIYDSTNGSVSRGSIWDVGGDIQGRGTSMAWVINNANTSHVTDWGGY